MRDHFGSARRRADLPHAVGVAELHAVAEPVPIGVGLAQALRPEMAVGRKRGAKGIEGIPAAAAFVADAAPNNAVAEYSIAVGDV